MSTIEPHPCQQCGACCAAFRVSFHWIEADPALPEAMVEPISRWHAAMRGTNQAAPHCIALQGEVGTQVSCSVYAARPSACREVQPGDEQCGKARERYGLGPLRTC